MSRRMEIRITKPKLARSVLVKLAVCVRNPGPMAEVAIRKAALVRTLNFDGTAFFLLMGCAYDDIFFFKFLP